MCLDGWNDVHNAPLISIPVIKSSADTYFTLTIDILEHSNTAANYQKS